jgi:hypothetical protein
MADHKTYLGDSVYAELEHGDVLLTTDNGMGPSNRIVLERQVLDNLITWAERLGVLAKGATP